MRVCVDGLRVRSVAGFVAWLILSSCLIAYPLPGAAEAPVEGEAVSQIEPAQFQLPPAPSKPGAEPAPALPRQLKYEYVIGSESEGNYRRNSDLDSKVSDDFATLQPQVNVIATYRPTDWLETRVEVILERQMLIHGNRNYTLPDGQPAHHPADRNSLLLDQAYFTIHNVTDPFVFSLGRRNYEDERHWLYDTSLDIGAVGFKGGRFRAEASFGREALVDLDALQRQQKDRVNTLILYGEYRAFEDTKLAAYTIRREDRDNRDGRWQILGLRSIGFPTESFNYWTEFAATRGRDENSRRLAGYGLDVGGTYRFRGLPLNPNITLSFAYGSGDHNMDDDTNGEFRQSGLQSNLQKFAGLAEFKYYGEALDPELSNLKILTVGLGFRPWRDISVDFIYHRYWLDVVAEDLRNSALTAQMNQDPTRASRDVGQALDVVLGFRNVFGIQRLGIDVRGGLFFPGSAFRNDRGDDNYVDADSAAAVVAKFWL